MDRLRPPSGLLCEHFRPQEAEKPLPILWVRVGTDVLVALNLPEGGLGIPSRTAFGRLPLVAPPKGLCPRTAYP